MKDARALLILLRACGNAAVLRRLLDRFGQADAALGAGPAAWQDAGIAPDQHTALERPDPAQIDADLTWLATPDHHLIGWHDADYPALLRRTAEPPAALFVAGDRDLLWHAQIALVGSRKPSAGGRDHAGQFARRFAAAGLTVTSGLAEGIDTAAHRGALTIGRTLAVIGTGTDVVYPAGNRELMARIRAEGAIVSEYAPGTPPRQLHFPQRNRLIAGLSLGTLVVEAALRSGALITARLAADAGREVFALPGSIDNPMARGCHRLLRQGVALVESPDEVIDALRPLAAQLAEDLRGRLDSGGQGGAGAPLPTSDSQDTAALWRALGHDPATPDQLAERTGLTVATLSAMLLTMELDGRISAEYGRYARRP